MFSDSIQGIDIPLNIYMTGYAGSRDYVGNLFLWRTPHWSPNLTEKDDPDPVVADSDTLVASSVQVFWAPLIIKTLTAPPRPRSWVALTFLEKFQIWKHFYLCMKVLAQIKEINMLPPSLVGLCQFSWINRENKPKYIWKRYYKSISIPYDI